MTDNIKDISIKKITFSTKKIRKLYDMSTLLPISHNKKPLIFITPKLTCDSGLKLYQSY